MTQRELSVEITHPTIARFAQDKVNLPRDRAQKYRDQVNNLRDRLKNKIDEDPDFALVKMLHAGSVAKGTGLRHINDLDVAIYVRRADAPSDDDLVPWLADRLHEATPNMTREQFIENQHSVTIVFRGSGLDVDAVPVIYDGAEDGRGDLINRRTGERVETSIPLHLEFIRARRKSHGDGYPELIRLSKSWKREATKTYAPELCLKSFIIELVWAHLADSGTDLTDYPRALEQFFVHLAKRIDEPIAFDDYGNKPAHSGAAMEVIDPVNPANNIAKDYTTADRDRISEAAIVALSAINEAAFAPTKGREVELWRRVFGPSFGG